MRFSELRKRAVDDDMSRSWCLELLESPFECEWVDFKEDLPLDTHKGKASLAKDALAIHNSGGGYIVLGVRDKTWEQVGFEVPYPHDAKELIDQVQKVAGVHLEIRIAQHQLLFGEKWNYFPMIHIRGPSNLNKLKSPARPKKGFFEDKDWGLIRNVAYFRQ